MIDNCHDRKLHVKLFLFYVFSYGNWQPNFKLKLYKNKLNLKMLTKPRKKFTKLKYFIDHCMAAILKINTDITNLSQLPMESM